MTRGAMTSNRGYKINVKVMFTYCQFKQPDVDGLLQNITFLKKQPLIYS